MASSARCIRFHVSRNSLSQYRGRKSYTQPDQIVKYIHCPRLKHLVIRNTDLIVSLGDRLPALDILEIHPFKHFFRENDGWLFSRLQEGHYTADEKWDRLVSLMQREIQFVQCGSNFVCERLLQFVIHHTDRRNLDPLPVAEWLITSGQAMYTREDDTDPPILDIDSVSSDHRVRILRFLKSLKFGRRIEISTRLFDHDTIYISRVFPRNISELNLKIKQHISPKIIHQIIRRLPRLRSIWIELYVEGNDAEPFPKASCTHVSIDGIIPDMSIANALLDPNDDAGTHSIILQVFRNYPTDWSMTNCSGDHPTDISYQKLEEEVDSWFSLNPTLDRIVLQLSWQWDECKYWD
jgi:hypothetical protein